MPLCAVNLDGRDLADPAQTEAHLAAALATLPRPAPVIVLIHGYKFSPRTALHTPHRHILSLEPRRRRTAISWPAQLGVGCGEATEPLCIALGWEARGSLWRAYREARRAGSGLATLVRLIRRLRPGQPVDLLAHSLGARVALSALPHLPSGALRRAILLAPAEMRSRAADNLDCAAGRALEVLHVASRENAVFDRMLEWLVAPHRPGDRALGAGGPRLTARWTDVRIDDPRHLSALHALGHAIPHPDQRICHWSVYRRQGLFPLYRAILCGSLRLSRLAAVLPSQALPDSVPQPRGLGLPGLSITASRP